MSRAGYTDEARLRRTFRATAILGLIMELFFVRIEITVPRERTCDLNHRAAVQG